MKKYFLFLSLTVLFSFSTAQAAIVYSTYSSGDSYTGDWLITNTIWAQNSDGSDMAGKFTIEAIGPDYYLDSIKMYIKDEENVTDDFLTLGISGHDSTNNIPDTSAYVLSPVDFTNNIPNMYSLIEFNPVERPILYAGNTYWLLASVEDETVIDLIYYWTSNRSLSVGSTLATRTYNGNWDDLTYWPLAYQIIGTPVPLPGAVWLLGSGLICLIGLRRKKN